MKNKNESDKNENKKIKTVNCTSEWFRSSRLKSVNYWFWGLPKMNLSDKVLTFALISWEISSNIHPDLF